MAKPIDKRPLGFAFLFIGMTLYSIMLVGPIFPELVGIVTIGFILAAVGAWFFIFQEIRRLEEVGHRDTFFNYFYASFNKEATGSQIALFIVISLLVLLPPVYYLIQGGVSGFMWIVLGSTVFVIKGLGNILRVLN